MIADMLGTAASVAQTGTFILLKINSKAGKTDPLFHLCLSNTRLNVSEFLMWTSVIHQPVKNENQIKTDKMLSLFQLWSEIILWNS